LALLAGKAFSRIASDTLRRRELCDRVQPLFANPSSALKK
jgi:hypothetical protein